MKSFNKLKVIFLIGITLSSCKKLVEVEPPKTQIIESFVFERDETATAAVLGIYSQMMGNAAGGFANDYISRYAGLSSDELKNYSTSATESEFYSNSLTTTNSVVSTLWKSGYQYIYYTNAIIEGINNSNKISNGVRKQLIGEAKFIRAFCNFYLVNLFGDIPIVTTTNYQINNSVSRSPIQRVYQQIVADLIDAKNLLNVNYVKPDNSVYSFSSAEKVRPNKWTAAALLARVYLYMGDYVNAENQASEIINSAVYNIVADLTKVFLKNSTEAIWQLQPIISGFNTQEGSLFILTSTPTFYSLSNYVLNSFETGDERKNAWVGSLAVGSNLYYFPYKYRVKTGGTISEYYTVFRLAEQYLIRAEARAQMNNISGAQSDLNLLRNRANLSNTSANDKPSLLLAIEHERQVELFAEWGHRWFDLKRLNHANTILGPIKSSWQPTDVLYPIPQEQILRDPNTTQNPGY